MSKKYNTLLKDRLFCESLKKENVYICEMEKEAILKKYKKLLVEKILKDSTSLTDTELVDLLLLYGIKSDNLLCEESLDYDEGTFDAIPPSADYLCLHFGTRNVQSDKCGIPKTGDRVNFFKAVRQVSRIYKAESKQLLEKIDASNSDLVGQFFAEYIGKGLTERVAVLYLDEKDKVVHLFKIEQKNRNLVFFAPEEIKRLAFVYGACSVWVAHNHPSAMLLASAQDIASYCKLESYLSMSNIEVKGYFLIHENDYCEQDVSVYKKILSRERLAKKDL